MKFHKMHGCGNDFILLDQKNLPFNLTKDNLILLGDRYYGIGCDQILIYDSQESHTFLTIYNQDGSEAANCGNGLRCLNFLLYQLTGKEKHKILLKDGRELQTNLIKLYDNYNGLVEASLGPASIKKISHNRSEVFLGNKHLIIALDNLSDLDIERELNNEFNISLVQYDGDSAKVRVYERGVGETKACGSAAGAVHLAKGSNNPTEVNFITSGESLLVTGGPDNLTLYGEASLVYEGSLYLK